MAISGHALVMHGLLAWC